jgi:hypothetical protein
LDNGKADERSEGSEIEAPVRGWKARDRLEQALPVAGALLAPEPDIYDLIAQTLLRDANRGRLPSLAAAFFGEVASCC